MEVNKLYCIDAIELLKRLDDYSANIIFTDPPYALGSEVIIRKDGKPDYKKAVDFMNKWDQPDGAFWETWFKEAFRVLKYGGRVVMFGMDRQLMLNKYYACFAGFIEQQSLYWYFICLSDDSEILTNNGWRKIDNINGTDKVAEYDLITEQVIFKEPKKIHKFDFDGELAHIVNKETEQLLTFNHKCVTFVDGKLKEQYAHELIGRNTRFVTVDKKTIWKISWLQNLRELREGVSVRWEAVSQNNLFKRVLERVAIENKNRKTITNERGKGAGSLRHLWEGIFQVEKRHKTRQIELLQQEMQIREVLSSSFTERFIQQREETDRIRKGTQEDKSSEGKKELSLEGRGDIQTPKGKLCWSKICSLPIRIFSNGKKGRVCDGTQIGSSKGNRQDIIEDRNSASCEPYSFGQSSGEFNTIQEQSGSQKIRSRTPYNTSMAVPTTRRFTGRVWCVETSTGAFIARRNGKAFITGNSNFPKASDLSKNLDKNAGVEREVIGVKQGHEEFANRGNKSSVQSLKGTLGGKGGFDRPWMEDPEKIEQYHMATAPTSDLAKKYDGYKYSIAPLKQTCETIMVFQKPYKTGSCLHDTLAYENGDQQTLCGALDIDGERCGVDGGGNHGRTVDSDIYGKFGPTEKSNIPTGRYPSQTFVDSEAGEILDRQSGSLTRGKAKIGTGNIDNQEGGIYGSGKGGIIMSCFAEDKRGCSKILHHCDYDTEEFDLYIYCPKVSKSERNAGLNEFPDKVISGESNEWGQMGINSPKYREGRGVTSELPKVKNNHPTLKPLSLIRHILKLFKTPNPQLLIDSFAGSGTILMIAKELEIDYIGSEISQEYCTIAEARISPFNSQPTLF